MNRINKQKFISELSKLLTFMFDEDRLAALDLYSAAFDASEDEAETARRLVSPTRQAVVIARAYDVKGRTMVLENQDGDEYSDDEPAFISAIRTALSSARPAAPKSSSPAPEETGRKPDVLDDLDAFVNDIDASIGDEYRSDDDDVDSFLGELESESGRNFETKTVVWRLILFLVFAVPVGLVLVMLMLFLSLLCFALTAASGALGVVSVSAAFGTGFAMISDILVVGGLAVLLLALGLLFLWCAVWFIVGAVPGVIRGIVNLGRRLCVKEVSI